MSWLRCDIDKSDKTLADTLWCEACRKHEEKLRGMKNYSSTWVKGSTNHKTSSVLDHANSDQHKAALIQANCSRIACHGWHSFSTNEEEI